MTRDEAMLVRPGDSVIPDPMWNATTSIRHRKLPDVVVVKGVATGRSQTGVVFRVETIGKDQAVLDAGWFSMPESVE